MYSVLVIVILYNIDVTFGVTIFIALRVILYARLWYLVIFNEGKFETVSVNMFSNILNFSLGNFGENQIQQF